MGFAGGTGTLNLNPGGTLSIGGANAIFSNGTANFNLAGGTLKVSGSDFTTSLPASLTGLTTVNTNGLNATFSGALSGSGGISKSGAGVLTLSGINSYSGATAITAGTLAIAGSGESVLLGGVSGSGTLLKSGTGLLLLGGLNKVAVTIVSGGTLQTLSANSAVTVSGNGTLYTSTSYLDFGTLGTGSVTVNDGASVSASSSITLGFQGTGNANVSGSGSALQAGTFLYLGVSGGTGTLNVSSGGVVSAGTVTFADAGGTGTLNLNAGGILRVGGINGIVTEGNANFNLAGGTLQVVGADLSTTLPATLTNTTTVDTNGLSATLSGSLTGTGGLIKSGLGTLMLLAENSYDGPTTVMGGTLDTGSTGKITGSSALFASGILLVSNPVNQALPAVPLTLDSGTLKFGDSIVGATQILTALNLDHAPAIDFGKGTTGNTFQFASFTLAPTFTGLNILNWTPGNADHLVFQSGTFSGADLSKISFYDDSNTYLGFAQPSAYGTGFQLIAVPEPATGLLFLISATALAGRRYRRKY